MPQRRRRAHGALLLVAITAAAAAGWAQPAATAKARRHASITKDIDCGACHTPDGWKSLGGNSQGAGFDHDKTGFPLRQDHRIAACIDCHDGERQVSRQCSSCHQDPHAARLGARCEDCHNAGDWWQTEAIARHRRTRLPLTGMHALVECRDCHQRTNERTFTSTPADCFACHLDDYQRPDIHPPHIGVAGDPDRPPFPRDCERCHRPTAWVPAFVPAALVAQGFAPSGVPDPTATAKSASTLWAHEAIFPLRTGAHRGAECASCHTSAAAPAAVRCDGCHEHSAVRLASQHQKVAGFGTACLSCHPGGMRR